LTPKEKRLAALEQLSRTGIMKGNYAPPLFRLLWKLGFEVPPPHFRSWAANFGTLALWMALALSLLRWLWPSLLGGPSLLGLLETVLISLFFGIAMAFYYRHGARKHNLPAWRDFDRGKPA
jgi:hypothetical protein